MFPFWELNKGKLTGLADKTTLYVLCTGNRAISLGMLYYRPDYFPNFCILSIKSPYLASRSGCMMR